MTMTHRSALLTLAAVAVVAPIGFTERSRATHARPRDTSGDFSRDGCRTDADMRYRRDMLRNVAIGLQSGQVLTRERTWVR